MAHSDSFRQAAGWAVSHLYFMRGTIRDQQSHKFCGLMLHWEQRQGPQGRWTQGRGQRFSGGGVLLRMNTGLAFERLALVSTQPRQAMLAYSSHLGPGSLFSYLRNKGIRGEDLAKAPSTLNLDDHVRMATCLEKIHHRMPFKLKQTSDPLIINKLVTLASRLGLQSQFLTKLKNVDLQLKHIHSSSQGKSALRPRPESPTKLWSLRVTQTRLVGLGTEPTVPFG